MPVKQRGKNKSSKQKVSGSVEEIHDSIQSSVDKIEGELDDIRKANEHATELTETSKTDESDDKKPTTASSSSTPKKKSYKDSRKFIFILGTVIGVLVAVYFGARDNVDLSDFDNYVNFESLQYMLEDWKDALPTNLQSVIKEFQNESSNTPSEGADFSDDFAVGKALKAEQNLTAKHPVIMIPGVISTGIESWGLEGTPECPSQPHFRKRLWGSMYMIKAMLLDKSCWLKHIMLDLETGLDPPGFKLRAAQGFEAADFFITGYWLWNKILQNLSAIGYEPNKMVTAAYDWRLSYLDLERRDFFFSRLKYQIESEYKFTGEKSILIGHSMGSQIGYYFMKWVEAEGEHFGNGGSDWVNKYIHAYIDVSGSMLGAPKAVPALLSGEMKDTVQLNALAIYGLEKFFSRKERLELLRSFGGIASMLPKGGDLIWGNLTNAFEDKFKNFSTDGAFDIGDSSLGNFIRFDKEVGIYSQKNLTVGDSIDFVIDNSPEWFSRRTREQYSFGVSKSAKELQLNNQDFSKWSNPLEAPLPNAPDLKIYCFYGIGKPTERAYIYQEEENKDETKLNVTIVQPSDNKKAVYFTDGDGTIPIASHAMCHKWKNSPGFNPGNSQVKVVEMKHSPDRFDIRGGAKTAEHVDILGRAELNELILKVASGRDDLIEEKIITELSDWVESLDFGFE